MITAIQIRANPLSTGDQIAVDLHPGEGTWEFESCQFENRAYGGFWNAMVRFRAEPNQMREFLDRGLGREVVFRNENGGVDFEGFVNTIRLNQGGTMTKISLDSMANKIWVRYKDLTGTFARSAVAQEADSQARFGIKEQVISGGQITSTSVADGLAEMLINRKGWPKKTVERLATGGGTSPESYLELGCLGWIHTLEWTTYNQTASTGTTSADTEIATILTAAGQFVADTQIRANPIGVTKEYDADRTAMSIILDIARLGDTRSPPQRWVCGMKEGRVFYYLPAAPEKFIAG